MAYSKTTWIARVGTALNRFLKTNEDAGSVELTNDPTGITTAGTPFTVANMNNIETGIKDNDDRSLANEADNDTQDTAIGLNTTHRASDGKNHSDVVLNNTHRGLTDNPHSVDKDDLDLGTTDDVTFGTVNTGQGANELYDMDQNVKTTNSPTFVQVKADRRQINVAYSGIGLELTGAELIPYLLPHINSPGNGTHIAISGHIYKKDDGVATIGIVYDMTGVITDDEVKLRLIKLSDNSVTTISLTDANSDIYYCDLYV